MKNVLKYPLSIISVFFVGSLIMSIIFFSKEGSSMFYFIGFIPKFVIEGLRFLSQYSFLGNILAWAIFLLVIFVPTLIGWYMYKKDKNNMNIMIITIIFSSILAFLLYGMLNEWFLFTSIELPGVYYLLIYTAITSITIVFIIGIWIIYVLNNVDDKIQVFHSFQITLLLTAIVLTFSIAITLTANLTGQLNESDGVIPIILSLIRNIPLLLMIVLLVKIIPLLETMKKDMFDPLMIPPLLKLRKIAIWIVLLSLIIPLTLGLFQLVFINYLQNIDVFITIPLTELIIAFVILLVSEILIQSIAAVEENKTFI